MIKVGVIGTGKWGRSHLRAFSQLPAKVIGIADVDESKRALADEFGIKFFDSYEQLVPLISSGPNSITVHDHI